MVGGKEGSGSRQDRDPGPKRRSRLSAVDLINLTSCERVLRLKMLDRRPNTHTSKRVSPLVDPSNPQIEARDLREVFAVRRILQDNC